MKTVILFQPRMGYYDLVVRNFPLGLLSIARGITDFKVVIVDQRIQDWQQQLARQNMNNVVAIACTVMTGRQIAYALTFSRFVKQRYPQIPVIWGGVHPSLVPEETLRNPYIDIIVTGEADILFPEILKKLDSDDSFESVPGIWYKDNNDIKHTTLCNVTVDLDSLTGLPYHLIDIEAYRNHAEVGSGTVLPVETGRGCPHQCTYCYNNTHVRNRWRGMSAQRIVYHVEHLRSIASFDGINFIDDNFFASRQRIIELMDILEEHRVFFDWGSEVGIKEIQRFNDDELTRMVTCGLRWLSIGVESGDQSILNRIHKNISVDEIISCNKRLAKYPITAKYNFMNGYIWEGRSELRHSTRLMLRLLEENKRATVQTFNIIVPYPGTPYLDECAQSGLAVPRQLEKWVDYNPDDWINYPPWLSNKKKRLLKVLYIASIFIDRKARRMFSYQSVLIALIKAATILYYPFAWLRFKWCCGILPVENAMFDWFKKHYVGEIND